MSNALIITGDCLDTLRRMPDASVDAVVTDPPYGLSKEPDALEVLRHWLAGDDYEHRGRGFMGKTWDSFVPGPTIWCEVLRVLKPGGHACVFAGSRTVDLMGLSLRIAGFEIRDQLQWLYGSGFPKSLNVETQILKKCDGDPCAEIRLAHPWHGYGTALKPAHEPIVLARKPLAGTVAANALKHGTGALNIDGCRIGSDGGCAGAQKGDTPGNALVGSVDGSLNGSFAPPVSGLGRWPANVILDEAAGAMLDEQTPDLKQRGNKGPSRARSKHTGAMRGMTERESGAEYNPGDSGGASRFFYCAKTSKREREAGLEHLRKASAGELTGGRAEGSAGLDNPRAGAGRTSSGRANVHPTVKPIDLMRWLVRLVTPSGGLVLDPFAGSGSTGCAAVLEGAEFLGCELSEEYATIARARIAHWSTKR